MNTQNSSDRVVIFDTTLRDGNQAPGFKMSTPDKVRMAHQLERLGVDVIEAGFAASNDEDFAALTQIVHEIEGPTVATLARAVEGDIRKAGAVIEEAAKRGNGRIHTFIATSDIHMRDKLQKTPDQVLEITDKFVRMARQHTDDVEWSAEDAMRSDPDFLVKAAAVAIEAGARTINIPDTVGYTDPDEYRAIFEKLRRETPRGDKVIWSTHCHDDLGQAVANTLAGVKGGARQVEVTINGIGERAGNAQLEAVVMAMRTRPSIFPVFNNIVTQELVASSKMLSEITGQPVMPNTPIVGGNAFAHESGIHQDGMIKANAYEIMTPEDVGAVSTLVLGQHSGSAVIVRHFARQGIAIERGTAEFISGIVKNWAAQGHEVTPDHIDLFYRQMQRGMAGGLEARRCVYA